MSGINDGGPAFPAPDAGEEHFSQRSAYMGMSLRDYMATHADLGPVERYRSAPGEALIGRPCPADPAEAMVWWADYRAALRYIEADAMLRAREVKP